METEQYKDVIKELSVRGVQRSLAHKILEYLDYSSLKNASLVSSAWCKAVKTGYLWTKLFERNIEFDPVWRQFYQRDKIAMFQLIGPLLSSHSELFQQHCDYIHQCQENLMRNWRQRSFTRTAVIDVNQCYYIQPFAMDQSRFVSYVAANEHFYVVKRWQQKFERTIPCPKMRVEEFKLGGGILVAICFTMDGQYRGSIRVWNVESAQLVHVFDDSLALRDPRLYRVLDSPTLKMHLSECGRYLITFVSISQYPIQSTTATSNENEKRLLTLRKFKTPEQVTVVHQLHHHLYEATKPSAQLVIVKSLFVDSRYVILFLKMFSIGSGDESSRISRNVETIEIRSTLTFHLLHSIAVPQSSILLHYSSGYLMLSLLDSSNINFWSAKSGTCVGALRFHQGLHCASIRARLIGDRFVFVYCLRGFVRVYDLQSLLHQQKRERASAHEKEEDEWLYQFDMLRDQGPMSHLVTDQCQVFLFGSSAQGVDLPRKVYVAGMDFAGSNVPQLTHLFPVRLHQEQ